MTSWNSAFEIAEEKVVVPDLDGETFYTRLFGHVFWCSTAFEHTFSFQAEIEVVRPSLMLLDYELRHGHRFAVDAASPAS